MVKPLGTAYIRRMKTIHSALIGLAIICGPVTMGSFIWGLVLIKDQVPVWVWVLVIVCNVMVGLGLASLLDRREQQTHHREP